MIHFEEVVLREVVLKLKEPFQISTGTIDHRRVFLLECRDESGISVWSECVAKGMPNYSPEIIDTAWIILVDWILPKVLGRTFGHPREVSGELDKTVRGNHMAKAGIEMAAWALTAEKKGCSLAEYIGGTRTQIETGISIGIQDSPDLLVERVQRARAQGYRKLKIKIKPGYDRKYLEAVRNACGQSVPMMADANSAYTLEDREHLKSLDELGLMMIEQPLAYDDIREHAQLIEYVRTPICLDESITGVRQAKDALVLGSADIINIKPGRVGGLEQAIRVHDLCQESSVPVWCGGMLESGVGRAYNVAFAALPNCSLPGDLSPSDRYWTKDVIESPWTMDGNGMMNVPLDVTGIGVNIDQDYVEQQCVKKQVVTVNGVRV